MKKTMVMIETARCLATDSMRTSRSAGPITNPAASSRSAHSLATASNATVTNTPNTQHTQQPGLALARSHYGIFKF